MAVPKPPCACGSLQDTPLRLFPDGPWVLRQGVLCSSALAPVPRFLRLSVLVDFCPVRWTAAPSPMAYIRAHGFALSGHGQRAARPRSQMPSPLEALLKHTLLPSPPPPPRVSESIGLGTTQKLAFLTCSQVLLLSGGARLDPRWPGQLLSLAPLCSQPETL